MTYADFLAIMETAWTMLALLGIGLGVYLLRAEQRDRALTIAENGRTGILSWALVSNEVMRVSGQVLLLAVGVGAIAMPNPTTPATPVGPVLTVMLVLFSVIGVAQSSVLIYARARIARYVPATATELLARQETLLDVQRDVGEVADKVGGVKEKIAELVERQDATEVRADDAEKREENRR